MKKVRPAAVAGYFYPGIKEELESSIDGYLDQTALKEDFDIVVLPHAGYIYSGSTVGAVLSGVNVPRRVVLLGPKHTRRGKRAAVSSADFWSFPFGDVPVDGQLTQSLAGKCGLEFDDDAHGDEHSLEVEVPFLWRCNPDLLITPIALGYLSVGELKQIGELIAQEIRELDEPVLLVVSTDMSHQIPLSEAEVLDGLAIEKIVDLDPEGLYQTVSQNQISMCGVIPMTTALFAAKKMGICSARLVKYTTSAEASGDESQVVGYAGLVLGR